MNSDVRSTADQYCPQCGSLAHRAQATSVDAQAMIEWRRYEIDNHVRNGCGYIVTRALGDSSWAVSNSIDIDGAVNLNKLQARSPMP